MAENNILNELFNGMMVETDDELVDVIETDYGFMWGPLEVIRAATVYGKGGAIRHFVLTVATDRQHVDLLVTPGGRSIKVVRN